MKPKKQPILVFLFALLLGAFSPSDEAPPRPFFQKSLASVYMANGQSYIFTVEVADTQRKQAYGLSYLTSLDDDKGMIFPYTPPREVKFWMKNTRIPLDLLFVAPDGAIIRIARGRAGDVTPIPSGKPVIAVIEIKGGLADKYGIDIGDKVYTPLLPQTKVNLERQAPQKQRN